MEINKKFILVGCIWFCMLHVFSQEDIKTFNDRLEVNLSTNSVAENATPKIIFQPKLRLDSYVTRLQPNAAIADGANVIGNYAYEIDSKFAQNQSDVVAMNQIVELYKLVEMPNGQYFLSNGNIIVTFKDNKASKNLEQEFGLQTIKQFNELNMIVYRANSFSELERLIESISAREEVDYVELDLINPYLAN